MHLPPDLVRHAESYDAQAIPRLWGHDFMKIQMLHDMGYTGKGIKIGVGDTGYRRHPLLPEPLAARDFTGSRSGVTDNNGHGSHVASTAVGLRDETGKALGVAPDAELIVAKVLGDNGSGSTTGINRGRVWMSEQGADVISESLGDGGGPRIPEDIQAFEEAYSNGVSICCAALGNAGFQGVGRPGSYKENCGVAALRENGQRADFSSVGDPADLALPGQNIIGAGLNNNLVSLSGTSMATPMCAALLAVLLQYLQENGYKRPMGWREWREFWSNPEFAHDAGPDGHDPQYGWGIPSVEKIVDWMIQPKGV